MDSLAIFICHPLLNGCGALASALALAVTAGVALAFGGGGPLCFWH